MVTAEELEAGLRAPPPPPVVTSSNALPTSAFSFFCDDELELGATSRPPPSLPVSTSATIRPFQNNTHQAWSGPTVFKKKITVDDALTNHLNALRERDLKATDQTDSTTQSTTNNSFSCKFPLFTSKQCAPTPVLVKCILPVPQFCLIKSLYSY